MSRRQRAERAAMGGDPYKTAIIRLMREFSHSHDPYTVFSDFVEICALAISNRIDQTQFEPREKRYLEIVGKYKHRGGAALCRDVRRATDVFPLTGGRHRRSRYSPRSR